jgi:hypothetical protein
MWREESNWITCLFREYQYPDSAHARSGYLFRCPQRVWLCSGDFTSEQTLPVVLQRMRQVNFLSFYQFLLVAGVETVCHCGVIVLFSRLLAGGRSRSADTAESGRQLVPGGSSGTLFRRPCCKPARDGRFLHIQPFATPQITRCLSHSPLAADYGRRSTRARCRDLSACSAEHPGNLRHVLLPNASGTSGMPFPTFSMAGEGFKRCSDPPSHEMQYTM